MAKERVFNRYVVLLDTSIAIATHAWSPDHFRISMCAFQHWRNMFPDLEIYLWAIVADDDSTICQWSFFLLFFFFSFLQCHELTNAGSFRATRKYLTPSSWLETQYEMAHRARCTRTIDAFVVAARYRSHCWCNAVKFYLSLCAMNKAVHTSSNLNFKVISSAWCR